MPRSIRARVALCSALLLPAAIVRADEQRAQGLALFEEGRKLVGEGKHADACPKFEEAFSLIGGVGVAYNLADCWEHTGRVASAWAMFGKAAVLAGEKKDKERERLAKDHAQALEPRLPHLVVRLAGAAPPGLEVKAGKLKIGSGSFGTKLPVDPGSLTVEATAPGRRPWSRTLSVVEKQDVEAEVPELELEAPRPPPSASVLPSSSASAPPPPPPPDGLSPLRVTGVSVAAGGGALVALGAVLGGLALGRHQESLKVGCDADSRCLPDAARIRDDARGLGDASTALFIVGSLAAAAGVTVFLLAPSKPRARPPATVLVTPLGAWGTW